MRKTNPVQMLAGFVVLLLSIQFAGAANNRVIKFSKASDGVVVSLQVGTLRLQVWSDDVVRATYAKGEKISELKSLSVIGLPETAKWDVSDAGGSVLLQTASLEVKVDKQTGAVGFFDNKGNAILQESSSGREISPATQEGVSGTLVRQSFVLPGDEGIYGLGQHQQGYWNYRGHDVKLLQENREVGIPVLFSSKGYGVFWDNPAVTDISVGDANVAGDGILRWSSETGKAIDYYFVYGPAGDDVIGRYRKLTGDAPLMPRWLWGFWQSKERYRTQDELLGIAKRYRDLHIPIDGIIQDWRYWPEGNNTWGSHVFDKTRYPDPAAMFSQLHGEHFHALISVWPKFDLGSDDIKELEAAGAMYDPVIKYVFPPGQGKWYDAFNPRGREIYWKQISTHLFSLGVDGWWLDAPEPELAGHWGEFRTFKTAVGPGAEVFNAYPLMHSAGIYQGQRAQTSDKRVVILTRSAYAGQQRNSAITWSGDIGSTWQVFARQIPAGLNFSLCGIPYWNSDTGGFSERGADPTNPRYRELFTRWFQFSAFCPMFRVHGSSPDNGTGPGKEVWRFGQETQKNLVGILNLRYRLLPYIYSISWQVTSHGSTMMRPLVMDFASDPGVLNIGNQYMFGPAIMANPVTTPGATSRSVYLPAGNDWYDFWTGNKKSGGQRIDAAAPIAILPLFVRGGSILPMGPLIQYTGEKPADPLELRVYRGADANFTLYEDEGDGYQYEKGVHAEVPFAWNEAADTLTMGKRVGGFPGMLDHRTFRVVFVGEGHGAGTEETENADQTVQYSGTAVVVKPK